MLFAILITTLGLGLILAGALWRQQPAPRRLILIAVGILLLLLGGWKVLHSQDDARRTQPRSWSSEPAQPPDLAIAFGPEDLTLDADDEPPTKAAAGVGSAPAGALPSESAPGRSSVVQESVSTASLEPEPRAPKFSAPRTAEPVAPRATTSRQAEASRSVAKPGVVATPVYPSRVDEVPSRRLDAHEHDDSCCRWLPADGASSARTLPDAEPRWETASPRQPLAPTDSPGPCETSNQPARGGVCVELRNALGQGQRSERLQLFIEGRPVGTFELDESRPSQRVAVWLTYPGRFGYRLIGHVDYPDGRYALNSQGVFDARDGAALDVRITPWRDQVFLEPDPWSNDVRRSR